MKFLVEVNVSFLIGLSSKIFKIIVRFLLFLINSMKKLYNMERSFNWELTVN